jgi:hypothetical protein
MFEAMDRRPAVIMAGRVSVERERAREREQERDEDGDDKERRAAGEERLELGEDDAAGAARPAGA